jgi:hypothetical protein
MKQGNLPSGDFGDSPSFSSGSFVPIAPKTFTFFTKDIGGWWSFHGIHLESETILKLLEQFKHGKTCKTIVVLELPTGHVAYEWSDDSIKETT